MVTENKYGRYKTSRNYTLQMEDKVEWSQIPWIDHH